MRYVAFLRGVNVGGVTVKMADLTKLLEKSGFEDVKTLLASGNVIFESAKKDSRKLAGDIEKILETKYKRTIRVIVRPMHDLEMLAKGNPFKGIVADKNTVLYVTFLDKAPTNHFKTTSEYLTVTKTCPFAVCIALDRHGGHNSIDVMMDLTKHYGKDITTRNWNTVEKILKAA